MLQIGDRMPHFEVKDQDGNIVNSEELIGRKTIIYFLTSSMRHPN